MNLRHSLCIFSIILTSSSFGAAIIFETRGSIDSSHGPEGFYESVLPGSEFVSRVTLDPNTLRSTGGTETSMTFSADVLMELSFGQYGYAQKGTFMSVHAGVDASNSRWKLQFSAWYSPLYPDYGSLAWASFPISEGGLPLDIKAFDPNYTLYQSIVLNGYSSRDVYSSLLDPTSDEFWMAVMEKSETRLGLAHSLVAYQNASSERVEGQWLNTGVYSADASTTVAIYKVPDAVSTLGLLVVTIPLLAASRRRQR